MKLVQATFENFRLLRDLKLDFATDPDKRLTVVRAENESGKTTLLTALQWAFFGEECLPGKSEYRIHPVDWDVEELGSVVPIRVEVDIDALVKVGQAQESRKRFRIVRETKETIKPNDTYTRSEDIVTIFELTRTGAVPLDHPELYLPEFLPFSLREVFFTDGDRALAFIEGGSRGDRKRRVEKAIRALLGLDVIEGALRRVREAKRSFNEQARRLQKGGDLESTARKIATLEDEISSLRNECEGLENQSAEYLDLEERLSARLHEALKKGDRTELADQLRRIGAEEKRALDELEKTRRQQQELLLRREVFSALLAPMLEPGAKLLESLKDSGKIPKQTAHVLEEQLAASVCVCGESLDPDDPGGRRRREVIEKLLETSRRSEKVSEVATELYYESRAYMASPEEIEDWRWETQEILRQRRELQERREDLAKDRKALENRIQSLPDTGEIQEQLERVRQERARVVKDLGLKRALLRVREDELKEWEKQRERLLKIVEKGARVAARLAVAEDVETVLRRTLDRVKTRELQRVSAKMNSIFLEMIGSDPEENAIIQAARISEGFEIQVVGPEGRVLDPERDLNGASRRALTIAFILALTSVAGVEAPNVIDTPLGMMSGYVKRAVLRAAVENSSQLVLLLTRSEIRDCEDILDRYAGVVVTLTNPAHYPIMLLHDPGTTRAMILRCDCDHRSSCDLCARRDRPSEERNGS